MARYDIRKYKGLFVSDGAFTPASKEMYNFVIQNTRDKEVFIFSKPRIFTLMTNRRAIRIFDSAKAALASKADYLIMFYKQISYDQISFNDPLISQRQDAFRLIFRNEQFAIFAIIRKKDKLLLRKLSDGNREAFFKLYKYTMLNNL